MPISPADFWKLAVESRLLAPAMCEQLAQAFGSVKGASAQANAATLAEWLIAQNVLSRYQATILLAGRPGPFLFGDYRAYDRVEPGQPLAGAYRAVHVPTGHVVMLEFPRSELSADANRLSIACRAARALASADVVLAGAGRPRLRRAYELADVAGYKFLVAETIEGQSLSDVLTRAGRLPPPEACRLAWQAAQGLSQLHSLGLVHGRLTPDAVCLDPSGDAKLVYRPLETSGPIDFASQDTARILRLADWTPPELARPGRPPDLLTDIYALGCILYSMLTGQPPFAGGDVSQKIARHAGQPIQPLEPYGVPPPVAQLVAYMMAKNSATRVASAAAVVDALARWVPPAAHARPAPERSPTAIAYEAWLAEKPAPSATAGPAPVSWPSSANPSHALRPSTSFPTSRAAKRSSNTTWIGLAAAALVLVGGGGIYLVSTSKGPHAESAAPDSKTKQPKNPSTKAKPQPAKVDVATAPIASAAKTGDKPAVAAPPTPQPKEETIEDDGQSLWASPTGGAPISANYVGLGAQGLIALRPAALVANEEGKRMLAAFGPAGDAWRQTIESSTGVPLDQMESLVIALYATTEVLPPRASYVVRITAPADEKSLAQFWKGASPGKHKDKKIYASDATAYYLPPEAGGRTLVVAAPDTIREIIELEGPAQLGPQLDALVAASDAERHLTVVISPQFAFGVGRQIFSGAAQSLREPLAAFLGDDVRASLVSCHLADDGFFVEMRALVNVERKPDELAKQYHDRLVPLGDRIEDAQIGRTFSRYAEKLVRRYPGMLREAVRHTRHGREKDHAVLRCWLPPAAAHNLVLATELTLRETTGAPAAVVAKAPGPAPATGNSATGNSVAEKLKKMISLSFPRDTLEKSIDLWATESGVKAVILGSDLQLDGVTKNQSFDLDERNQTADAILRKILLKASPQGKLVYVIKREQPDAEDTVYITTRAQAMKRKDPLPPGFDAPDKKTDKKTAQKS